MQLLVTSGTLEILFNTLSCISTLETKMAAAAEGIRNEDWKEDMELKGDLQDYVCRNYRQREILDLMNDQYPMYAWSLRTLPRRLQFFEIKFIDYGTGVDEVQRAVEVEMKGPGSLLGYRALHKKIRELHRLNVPRNLVYDVMADINPDGLETRSGVGQPKRPKRDKAFMSSVMHESIPGVTIPPGTPPGICPIDSSRGSGICLSYMCTGAGYWRTPGI
jgi:hypothetical protein